MPLLAPLPLAIAIAIIIIIGYDCYRYYAITVLLHYAISAITLPLY
jgi:hypothetical protein